ncbi:hypothetical protein BH24CHL8_BH24CHL8_11080 [soil metagenome]
MRTVLSLGAATAIGIGLLAAPDLLGYEGTARTSHLIVGPIAASLAFIAIWPVTRALRWLVVGLGAWLLASLLLLPHPGEAFGAGAVSGVALIALASLAGPARARMGGGWPALRPVASPAPPDQAPELERTPAQDRTPPSGEQRPMSISQTAPVSSASTTSAAPAGQRPVVVITGASAGVGRATVRAFAAKGWDIGLLARGQEGLDAARREAETAGARALAISIDVADAEAVEKAAGRIEAELGPIEVWVNNAMTSVFARALDTSADEYRRVTEVTYLGYVHGTLSALRRMVPRDRGVIIMVGSALAYRSIPLQSAYCASKAAIRGFTDSVRAELLHDGSAVSLRAIHLPAVNTPQFSWVRSRLPRMPQPVPPIFQPEVPAEAIVWLAENDRREVLLGTPTAMAVLGQKVIPGLLDRYLADAAWEGQMTSEPRPQDAPDNLFQPLPGDRGAHGSFDDRAREVIPQWWLVRNRSVVAGLAAGAGMLAATLWAARHGER